MGKTARQFNKIYIDYKKKFKKPIQQVLELIPYTFSDDDIVNTFKELYPHLWDDLNKQYNFWHNKNMVLLNYGKKSRYNFRKPYNFILDCSFHSVNKLRKDKNRTILDKDDMENLKNEIKQISQSKFDKRKQKVDGTLRFIQEIEPQYTSFFIDKYFKTYDLHQKLEIMRELSKYKSPNITEFFYKVNSCTRNFSLKEEAQNYIQSIGLPFMLRSKKKGKKNYIDNEIVKNNSCPEVLKQRLYVDDLEKVKKFDVFISHNSSDMNQIVEFYKNLNTKGYVAYIDWVNDKYDLKREWCNVSTSEIIKLRIHQSKIFIIFLTESSFKSQWCSWELGYADALDKKIYVYISPNLKKEDIPIFYKGYTEIKSVDEIIIENY